MVVKNNKNGVNRCPKCGATDVALNMKTGKLKCNFCRTEFDDKGVNEYGGVENLKGEIVGEGATNIIPDEKIVLTLKCPACGKWSYQKRVLTKEVSDDAGTDK